MMRREDSSNELGRIAPVSILNELYFFTRFGKVRAKLGMDQSLLRYHAEKGLLILLFLFLLKQLHRMV